MNDSINNSNPSKSSLTARSQQDADNSEALNSQSDKSKPLNCKPLSSQNLSPQDLSYKTFNSLAQANKALIKCIENAQREVCILCHWLDPSLYDNEVFCSHLSRIARRHRYSRIRILMANSKPLHGRKHSIITLSQRLSSNIEIRVITQENVKPNTAFCICDNAAMVFFNQEAAGQGFWNVKASAKSRYALNEFNHLWLHYSAQDNELKVLTL